MQGNHNSPNNLSKLLVGFKSVNQIADDDQLQILSRNINTGYQQNECCKDGFTCSTFRPFTEKKRGKYIHLRDISISIVIHRQIPKTFKESNKNIWLLS